MVVLMGGYMKGYMLSMIHRQITSNAEGSATASVKSRCFVKRWMQIRYLLLVPDFG